MRRDTAAHNTVHDTLHNTVIVGAGVAGCCLAYRLASRGLPVTLLDKGRIGAQGASSVPLALLNPNRGRSARASLFDLASLEATWALVSDLEALGLDHGAHKTGVLRVASNARQAKGWQALAGV
ncbi:MAG: FAD-binding oxidoreductase, partial [Deinococcota bacterium]|nr:FAD-binding oxidoreductase [Deinococcota bacterium]